MEVLVLSQAEVAELLPMKDCIDAVADALTALAREDAVQPLRSITRLPGRDGLLGTMPGYLGTTRSLGVKAITVFPGNEGTPYDAHQGAVLLFEAEHGRLLALMDATEITAIRTAAATAVATRVLAREDSTRLAILGSGVQARTHLEAMLLVRPFDRIRVWSRTPDNAARFVERAPARHHVRIEAAADVAAAVEGADVVCCTTASREPVLTGTLLREGMHVNAVGAATPTARELDSEAVARSSLFVDRRESAESEAGDYLIPLLEGAVGNRHILAEIGEVLAGSRPGRRSPAEITLFKSLGLAVEDLAAADLLYRRALETGAGTRVEFGGRRRES